MAVCKGCGALNPYPSVSLSITAGMRFERPVQIHCGFSLPHTSNDKEVMRNTAIKKSFVVVEYLRLSC